MNDATQPSVPVRIDGLFETHLTVADLDRSVAFYRDVLGLPLARIIPERGVAFFWIGGPGKAMIGLWTAGTVLRMHLHLAMAVSLGELLAAPERLRAAGVASRGFGGELSDQPVVLCWMPAAAVYFTDPDGHSLEFLTMLPDEPRPDLDVVSWGEWQGLRRPVEAVGDGITAKDAKDAKRGRRETREECDGRGTDSSPHPE